MKAETTISVAGEPLSRHDEERVEVPALVIAWSAEEPWRVGEIAFVGRLGEPLVLGRGDDGEPDRVRLYRQRPGRLDARPALEGRAISRRQLIVRRVAAGMEVERVGRCPLLYNGAPVDRVAVTNGDVVHLKGQLVLYCTARPRRLPALRYFAEDAWRAFGEPDALGILGESPGAWRLRDRIGFASKTSAHVLIHGESGTGKELAARAIHRLSPRAGKPLVSRNAATFPATLIDAELFGNAKNYPNPGMPERAGLVGEANGGSLFLDEIGELPLEMQAHLLRVLDDGGDYQRLGEAQRRHVDLRFIGATNRPPSSLKHDLLARLTVGVAIEPLRERREDIPLLVRHLVLEAAEESPELGERFVARSSGRRPEVRVEAELIANLLRCELPANVRELESTVWNAMSESPSDKVGLARGASRPAPARRPEDAPPAKAQLLDAEPPGPRPVRPTPSADEVRAALARHDGVVRNAAKELGLASRFALYRLMKKYEIEGPEGSG